MLTQIAFITEGHSDYDNRLWDVLTANIERFPKCLSNLENLYSEYDFLMLIPLMVLAGASILNESENGSVNILILVEEDKMDEFYRNFDEQLKRILQ